MFATSYPAISQERTKIKITIGGFTNLPDFSTSSRLANLNRRRPFKTSSQILLRLRPCRTKLQAALRYPPSRHPVRHRDSPRSYQTIRNTRHRHTTTTATTYCAHPCAAPKVVPTDPFTPTHTGLYSATLTPHASIRRTHTTSMDALPQTRVQRT